VCRVIKHDLTPGHTTEPTRLREEPEPLRRRVRATNPATSRAGGRVGG
jgi:hypothetical protein